MVQNSNSGERRKPEGRKRSILAAASREFRTRGFHSTGMRDIAEALGMTVGNLYYYFRNKEELLAYCQEETLRRLQLLGAWVRGLDLRADERLYLLVAGHVGCLNEGTPGSLAHLEIEGLQGPWRDTIVERRDEYEREMRATIQDGIDAGVFRSLDVKVATFALLGAANWTVKWFRPDGGEDARGVGRAFAEHLVRGLLADEQQLRVPDIEIPGFEETED